ncbi:MAG: DUF937 domain-containing protein [Anaerolineales bacterium]
MDAITQQLIQQLSGSALSEIGKKIGADKQTASTAMSVALPLLVSALAKNSSQPKGAESLHTALAEDHDGSILDDISGFLTDPAAANGAGILKHVLGGQQPVVAKGVAKGTGLNADQVVQLLQIAAPLVMGLLGKQQQQEKLDTKGLTSFLGSQQQQVKESNPDLMGALNTLLDADQDGSALDDILGMAGKLLGGGK